MKRVDASSTREVHAHYTDLRKSNDILTCQNDAKREPFFRMAEPQLAGALLLFRREFMEINPTRFLKDADCFQSSLRKEIRRQPVVMFSAPSGATCWSLWDSWTVRSVCERSPEK